MMSYEQDLSVIGVTPDAAVPGFDDSGLEHPTSSSLTSENPTRKQVESNNLSRCMELTPLFGSAEQALVLNHSLGNDDLDSDEVTEGAVVSAAIGNATGLITAIVAHFCLRSSYRTGNYQVILKKQPLSDENITELKKNEIFLYHDSEKNCLAYVVKRAPLLPFFSSELVRGQIKLKDEEEIQTLLQNELVKLPDQPISSKMKRAFLRYTSKQGDTYSGKTSTNPLYRAVKTLSTVGARCGAMLSILVGSDNPNIKRILSFILSDIFCVVFGLFGVGYFLVRDKILKIPPNTKHEYAVTGLEGWSKYGKTALTFGTAIGQGIGGLIVGITHKAGSAAAMVSSFSISFWGGVVGVGSFVLSIIAVPLINWISSKFTRDGKGILTSNNKNKYRNNYTRLGITFGAALGVLLGFVIGNWCFGLIMAATIFSGLGAVVGGVLFSIYGHKLHKMMHPLPPGKTEKDEDIENSWDYVSRCTASVFGYVGAAVVCAINPAAALLLVPIGTAVASAIGCIVGILIMKAARRMPGNAEEKKAATLPWTQRITTGANVGSIIGSCIGVGLGFAGLFLAGPAGVIFAVSLCGAIGAVVGGCVGALYDKQARTLIWQAINPFASPGPAFVSPPRERSTAAKVISLEWDSDPLDKTPPSFKSVNDAQSTEIISKKSQWSMSNLSCCTFSQKNKNRVEDKRSLSEDSFSSGSDRSLEVSPVSSVYGS